MKKIVFRQELTDKEEEILSKICAECKIMRETGCVLISRGINTPEKVKKFINPGKKRFIDPFYLSGMEEAVARIEEAAKNGETIAVFGDYDVDGLCATSILYRTFSEMGINTVAAIPERDMGYGLSCELIDETAEQYFPDLIVTVDCGISNREEVEYIKELGIDVIVTDHHELPDMLPDCITVNPKLKGQKYPYDNLCGAGVAYKLSAALLGDGADKFLDLAALATVADSMALTGENRDIVFEGIKRFNEGKCSAALSLLLGDAYKREINETTLAFSVAPRINAAGRMGDVKTALNLFISDDADEMARSAARLTAYNAQRQTECDKLYRSAKAKLLEKGAFKNVIMLYDGDWKAGFIGIVASKLAEEYYRPVILFTEREDGLLKGSVRSIDEVNIFEALAACGELIEEFGGHSQAAGVSIKKENFDKFERAVDEYLFDNYGLDAYTPKIYCEALLKEPFTIEAAKDLKKLEPFGVGNKKPLYAVEAGIMDFKPIKEGSEHIGAKTPVIELIYFNGAKYEKMLNGQSEKKIVFEPALSVFNKREYVKGYVKDFIFTEKTPGAAESFSEYVRQIPYSCDELKTEKGDREFIRERLKECLKERYGTAVLVQDERTLQYFPELEALETTQNYLSGGNLFNSCIKAPLYDLDLTSFKTVIYLDEPLFYCNSCNKQKIYVNTQDKSYEALKEIRLERESMESEYRFLRSNEGKSCLSLADFYDRYGGERDEKTFILAAEIFRELNLIGIEKGRLIIRRGVKNKLENSKIYKKIMQINEK